MYRLGWVYEHITTTVLVPTYSDVVVDVATLGEVLLRPLACVACIAAGVGILLAHLACGAWVAAGVGKEAAGTK